MNTEGQPRRVFHPELISEQPQTEEVPAAPEEPTSPEPKRYEVGGKQVTADEAVRLYGESSREGLRLHNEVMQYKAQLEAERLVREELARREAPRPSPFIEPLRETDVDPALFEAAVAATAQRIVRDELTAALRPLSAFAEAQVDLKRLDPEFDPSKVQEIVAADQTVADVYNQLSSANPRAALQYGWTMYKASAPKSANVDEAALAAASVTPAKRSAPSVDPNARQKELEAALREAHATGNFAQYYALRSKGTSFDRGELR